MADLNQALISQFQPQDGLPPELLIALEELINRGDGEGRISATGFRQPATSMPGDTLDDGVSGPSNLLGRLRGAIGGGVVSPKSLRSSQEIGRDISSTFRQPQQTSAFGVTKINPIADLLAAFVPGGTLALGGVRAGNIKNIRDIQRTLGLDPTSFFNTVNPFSGLGRGSSTASLGRGTFGGTTADVTLGGVTSAGRTALTPTEARRRQISIAFDPDEKRALDARGGGGRGGLGRGESPTGTDIQGTPF